MNGYVKYFDNNNNNNNKHINLLVHDEELVNKIYTSFQYNKILKDDECCACLSVIRFYCC